MSIRKQGMIHTDAVETRRYTRRQLVWTLQSFERTIARMSPSDLAVATLRFPFVGPLLVNGGDAGRSISIDGV